MLQKKKKTSKSVSAFQLSTYNEAFVYKISAV